MKLLDYVKGRLCYEKIRPLIYDETLRRKYSTGSVVGNGLSGKTALVTGAGGGIGRAIVQRFIHEGCRVVMTDKSMGVLEHSLAQLEFGMNQAPVLLPMDLMQIDCLGEFARKVMHDYPISIWINCAGMMHEADKCGRINLDELEWRQLMSVNFDSVTTLVPIIADMMSQECVHGCIINIASILAYSLRFSHTAYAISKIGLVRYVECIAPVYAGKVSIVNIAPGTVVTPMGVGQYQSDISRCTNLLNHLIIPEEMAALVAFVAGGGVASYLSGKTIQAFAGEQL